MSLDSREISFRIDDIDGIVADMIDLAQAADGQRWLNVGPDVDESQIPTGSVAWRIFSSRGPVIPKVTWLPEHTVKGKRQHTEVGIAHATGANAIGRLADAGVAVPTGWVTVQDHTRRGILFAVPPGDKPERVLTLAVRALRVLSPFDLEDRYLATFWRR
jgi:hypothetical protein